MDRSTDGAVVDAVRAMREVITAAVVDDDHAHAQRLIAEHLATHGRLLIDAASGFIACHTTDGATPDLAEDRFNYLLHRVGDLIDLAAQVHDIDAGAMVHDIVDTMTNWEASTLDHAEAVTLRAAQTCLVAHRFVRLGHPSWGIQQNLHRADMMALNVVLSRVLMRVAAEFPEECLDRVLGVLLDEARHILTRQASAVSMPIETLIQQYFAALAIRESQRSAL